MDEFVEEWRMWCRLCAKTNSNTSHINVLLKNEYETKEDSSNAGFENLITTIERYFQINIKNDELPKTVCTECCNFAFTLAEFAERVSKVQQLFLTLQQIPPKTVVDYKQLRLKYELADDKTPEVLYVDTKPEINALEEQHLEETSEQENTNPLRVPRLKIGLKHEYTNDLEEADEEPICNLVDESVNDDDEDIKNAASESDASSELLMPEKLQQSSRKHRKRQLNSNRANKCKAKKSRKETTEEEADNDNAQFTCTDCQRQFKRIQGYRQHLKTAHDKEAPAIEYPCTQCTRVFTAAFKLKQHFKLHLPLELRKTLPCPHCDKKFTGNFFVQSHIRKTHMNKRDFMCEECGAALCSKVSLQNHILIHTNTTPFKCQVCAKAFRSSSGLKRHMEIHDTVKPICSECGLQLSSSTTLKQHMAVHSDEMQHKCDYCGRAFKRAKSLKVHLILHTGLKPYSCDFCELTFATGSNCRKHERTTHAKEFADLLASGGESKKTCKRNIPKLATLKAITKSADNLETVATKQSGFFAYTRKDKTHIN